MSACVLAPAKCSIRCLCLSSFRFRGYKTCIDLLGIVSSLNYCNGASKKQAPRASAAAFRGTDPEKYCHGVRRSIAARSTALTSAIAITTPAIATHCPCNRLRQRIHRAGHDPRFMLDRLAAS